MPTVYALLEVMDKEPTLVQVWVKFVVLGTVGGLMCSMWRPARWFVFPVYLLFALGTVAELTDPAVGPAILAGAGAQYFWLSMIALLVGGNLLGVGILQPLRGRLARVGAREQAHR